MKANECAGILANLYTCLPDNLRMKFGNGLEAALKQLEARSAEENVVLAETGTREIMAEISKRFDTFIFAGSHGKGPATIFRSGPVHVRIGLAEMMRVIMHGEVALTPYDDGSMQEDRGCSR